MQKSMVFLHINFDLQNHYVVAVRNIDLIKLQHTDIANSNVKNFYKKRRFFSKNGVKVLYVHIIVSIGFSCASAIFNFDISFIVCTLCCIDYNLALFEFSYRIRLELATAFQFVQWFRSAIAIFRAICRFQIYQHKNFVGVQMKVRFVGFIYHTVKFILGVVIQQTNRYLGSIIHNTSCISVVWFFPVVRLSEGY